MILFTLMKETVRSYETSVHISASRRHISEYGILHRLVFCSETRRCGDSESVVWNPISETSFMTLKTGRRIIARIVLVIAHPRLNPPSALFPSYLYAKIL
jgi:hypothetical protein